MALYDLISWKELDYSDYEAVFDFILGCIEQHAYTGHADDLRDFFLKLLARHFRGSVGEFIQDLRAAVWVAAHERTAATRMRLRPSTKEEITGQLARAYWEAEGGLADANWFRAGAFLEQC
jgi:hypothetical protein